MSHLLMAIAVRISFGVENTKEKVTLYLKMIPKHGKQSAEKSADSAEKSTETQETLLSERQKQILACMELEVLYKTKICLRLAYI